MSSRPAWPTQSSRRASITKKPWLEMSKEEKPNYFLPSKYRVVGKIQMDSHFVVLFTALSEVWTFIGPHPGPWNWIPALVLLTEECRRGKACC